MPALRKHHYTYCILAISGRNVWVGVNMSILPGVIIGGNRMIGTGSVVTYPIPVNSVTHGTPYEIVREIGDKDREYFYKNCKLDIWE